MTTGEDSYDWEEILERLDITFADFPDMGSLVGRLHEVLGYMPSQLQEDMTVNVLKQQIAEAASAGYTIDRFTRGGAVVTQLRQRGRFVASTELAIGAPSTQRLRQGAISAALKGVFGR